MFWEDFHAGLYGMDEIDNQEEVIKNCMILLRDTAFFYSTMKSVLKEWKNASEVNLTNTSRNREAWLGQSACCYQYGAPEFVTKIAWRMLSKDEQDKANLIADKVIYEFERKYEYGSIVNQEQQRLL